jgi:hypothetical protein
MGMPHDRTGLRHHGNHQWVFLSGMQPGDVLLFRYTFVEGPLRDVRSLFGI